jgi:hypothetical protein
METITDLKCAIWDIENEQKGLQNRFTQLEQAKSPLYQRLSELMTPKETDEKLE